MPNTEAAEARRRLEQAKRDLERAQQSVQQIERDCEHDWEVVDKPIYDEAYYIPGDKEMGREMGVDSLPGCHVSAKTTPRWIRTCKKCGKVEHTTQTRTESRIVTVEGGLHAAADVSLPDWHRAQPGPGREGHKRNRY